jgi:hypothetical protein
MHWKTFERLKNKADEASEQSWLAPPGYGERLTLLRESRAAFAFFEMKNRHNQPDTSLRGRLYFLNIFSLT